MIVLVNPRATRAEHRRFPLSLMALGAALPPEVDWAIVDGNRPDADVVAEVAANVASRGASDPVSLFAVSVMPGPQLAEAVSVTRRLKAQFPRIPVAWGGYFPSLYPMPTLAAPYVDWIVRGQGEQTLVELLDVLRERRDPATAAGLGYRERGEPRLNPERPWVGPDEQPPPPYARIDVDDYLHPTELGRRSGVYQASIGCPYACNFCGVTAVYGRRERFESPERTVRHLANLVERHGMDGLHFYDNNFFMGEPRTEEVCGRLAPLGLRWWCEARVDIVLDYADATWRAMRASGLQMMFFGAESGSDASLARMKKGLSTDKTLEVARRARHHGIVPEFSFILGGPDDPEGEMRTTLQFVRRLKQINPQCELIFYFYTPTPQRHGTYGDVDPLAGTPSTLEEWARPEWVDWMTHERPDVPWMTDALRRHLGDFELVLKSRFPSVHDRRTAPWGRRVGAWLAARRWNAERYDNPRELRLLRRVARWPAWDRQRYGHLRPPVTEQV